MWQADGRRADGTLSLVAGGRKHTSPHPISPTAINITLGGLHMADTQASGTTTRPCDQGRAMGREAVSTHRIMPEKDVGNCRLSYQVVDMGLVVDMGRSKNGSGRGHGSGRDFWLCDGMASTNQAVLARPGVVTTFRNTTPETPYSAPLSHTSAHYSTLNTRRIFVLRFHQDLWVTVDRKREARVHMRSRGEDGLAQSLVYPGGEHGHPYEPPDV